VDPDPAFQVNPDLDKDPGFDDQTLKRKIQLKRIIFFKNQKLPFSYP
jgi:hypothetical protein